MTLQPPSRALLRQFDAILAIEGACRNAEGAVVSTEGSCGTLGVQAGAWGPENDRGRVDADEVRTPPDSAEGGSLESVLVRDAISMAHRIVKEAYCIRELARKLSSRVWDAEELRELGQLGELADHVFETSRSFRDSAMSNGAQFERSSRLEDVIAAAVGASCLAEARERVDVDLGRGSAGSSVDPVMVDVLINLLENASAADPGGGRIKIRTRLSESWLEIEVEDRGAGMATETLDRCQELGFSTNSSTGGSGIGLAVAEAAVRAARGEIRIESEPGMGTCVLLRIPKSG